MSDHVLLYNHAIHLGLRAATLGVRERRGENVASGLMERVAALKNKLVCSRRSRTLQKE